MSGSLGVTELQHVLVLSDDIDRAREFYEQVLGLRAGDRPTFGFTGYWMYAGDTPCLHIADRASYRTHAEGIGLEVPQRISGPGQVDHIAFGASDYDAVSDRLARAGVTSVRRQIPGGGPRQLFFEDPDGQRLEINFREAGSHG
jgi:catechol 2,3-dioxygenase-like lactoylglutathione lyase family enzyme